MIRKLKKDNGSPGWTRLDVLAGPSQMTTSERHPGLTLQERPDAVLLDDFHYFVQSLPVGVERVIPDGRCIFLVYDLQYPTRVVLSAIDIDLNFDAVPGDFPAKRRHDNF